jgi:hypothetical protein
MDDNFKAIIQVMYDTAKGNKLLESELKQLQQKYKLNIDATKSSTSFQIRYIPYGNDHGT